MLMSWFAFLSDLNKETTYLLTYAAFEGVNLGHATWKPAVSSGLYVAGPLRHQLHLSSNQRHSTVRMAFHFQFPESWSRSRDICIQSNRNGFGNGRITHAPNDASINHCW